MAFRSYDSLRLFDLVARHRSFTAAARALNLTKGAVSYQMARLEEALGFAVFARQVRGVALTEKGQRLRLAAQSAFADLDREIAALREAERDRITIGLSTYIASRWLSPRLMTFIGAHPQTVLRLQPLIDLIDLRRHDIDLAIRWGDGHWSDLRIEPLFACPAFPTGGSDLAKRIAAEGLAKALPQVTHLHDRDGSTAWRDWYRAAGLPYRAARNSLVIPDPNVRVQAVIDGQGIALNDRLIADELSAKRLRRISDIALDDYGYFLAYPDEALERPGLKAFRDWILGEAAAG